MIREDCKQEVLEFIKKYPEAYIVTATTMYDGYVSCIKPIPTICGAELMCSVNTYDSLRELIGK